MISYKIYDHLIGLAAPTSLSLKKKGSHKILIILLL
jgi:hypothetical protein